MTILSRSKIAPLVTEDIEGFKVPLERGELASRILISPFDQRHLGPTSYDLHIGEQYVSLTGKPTLKDVAAGRTLRIEPGESVTLVSREYIGLPQNIAGMVFSKVSWLERGLSQISTYIHPGFYGHLMETLMNVSSKVVELDYGSAFCQLIFLEVADAKADERYTGERRGQTVDDLKRIPWGRNPHFLVHANLRSFVNTGFVAFAVMLGSAIGASVADIWPATIGVPISLALAVFFGGFAFEKFAPRSFR